MTAQKTARNAQITAAARDWAGNHPHIDWTMTEIAVRFTDAEGNSGHTLRVEIESNFPEHDAVVFTQSVWADGDSTAVVRVA